MATIAKPSSPGWSGVVPRYHKVRSRFVSPFSLESQSQVHAGERWSFDLSLPPMNTTQAAAWLAFVYELNRDGDNFSFVCSDYVPAGVTSPRLVRLVGNDVAWSINDTKIFGLTFVVEDDD